MHFRIFPPLFIVMFYWFISSLFLLIDWRVFLIFHLFLVGCSDDRCSSKLEVQYNFALLLLKMGKVHEAINVWFPEVSIPLQHHSSYYYQSVLDELTYWFIIHIHLKVSTNFNVLLPGRKILKLLPNPILLKESLMRVKPYWALIYSPCT